ncbi:hypothetical protein [Shinella sp.]|uniref:hypothetical protein n=1 Tax=Shinella sp. TaxID=1870904 RepID=UPI0039E4BC8D
MPMVVWAVTILGLVATFPEALRVYRKYGPLLAGVIWLLLVAIIWVYALAIMMGFETTLPTYLIVTHLLLVVAAPAALAIHMGRKYNMSVGVFMGGMLLPLTFVVQAMLSFGHYGGHS